MNGLGSVTITSLGAPRAFRYNVTLGELIGSVDDQTVTLGKPPLSENIPTNISVACTAFS